MTERNQSSREATPPASALYVNYFEVGYNPFEFLIDLGQYRAHEDDGAAVSIHTRIVTSPTHAKLLAQLLVDAVDAHESSHGPITPLSASLSAPDIVHRSLPEFDARAESARAERLSAARRASAER